MVGVGWGAARVGEQERPTSRLLGAPTPRGVTRLFPDTTNLGTQSRPVSCLQGRSPPNSHPLLVAWLQTMKTLSNWGRQGQSPSPNRCVILGKPLGISEPQYVYA